jgi:GNAT superfamily N-acetyltransferase
LILRLFDPAAGDASFLGSFRCSAGQPFEDDVESWVRHHAAAWLNDVPRAVFQRRQIAFIEDLGELVTVAAWQDIVRVDLDGIWLEVLAVTLAHQHHGQGQQSYELIIDHLRGLDRDGDTLAGLVHVDNQCSQQLLATKGWQRITTWGDHDFWVGVL